MNLIEGGSGLGQGGVVNTSTTADLAVWLHRQVSRRHDAAIEAGDRNTAHALSAVMKLIDVYWSTATQVDTYPWLEVLTVMAAPYANEPGYRTDNVE
jgi:hypothetical protein